GAAAGDRLDGHLYVLDGVAVEAPQTTRGIVAFGDSITDGAYATAPSKPWPQVLAGIANGAGGGTAAGVINAGISADELTTDQIGSPGAGASGLKRFERDVIDQPGVTDVIVLFGANDLNRGIGPAGDPTGASANDLIAGFRMLVDVAHAHHLRIYAGTITPFAGFPAAGWYSPQKEATRVTVNHWIRGSGAFDGVIDFADAVRGAYRPSPLAAQQKTPPPGMATVCAGDAGLHPNDLGYAVMGTQAYNALFHATLQPAQRCH
ncbi:MAG: GDSL-type esterase/lipase family protein, partial [Rhodanobacter sp.]